MASNGAAAGTISGVEGVVADVVAQAKALLSSDRAEQLELGVLDPQAVAIARASLPDGATRDQVVAEARRAGRPKGARNKRTDDFARWLGQFGPHPAVTMMRVQGMATEDLAKVAGCAPIEALDRQIRCASELLPYFEGKKPVAIDINANINGLGMLVIEGVTHSAEEIGEIIEGEFLRVGELDQDEEETAENSHSSEGDQEPSE